MKSKTDLKGIANNVLSNGSSMNHEYREYNHISVQPHVGGGNSGGNSVGNSGGNGNASDVHSVENEVMNKQLNKLYNNVILEESINLTAKETNYDINSIILNKLRRKIEGKCIKEGYVRKNSLQIVSRTMGLLINSDFNSVANFIVKYSSDICVVSNNQIVECEVKSVDKSQVICYIGDIDVSPVEIYLFKQHHIGDENYMSLQENDIIRVQVIKSRYEYNDKQIIVLGKFLEKL